MDAVSVSGYAHGLRIRSVEKYVSKRKEIPIMALTINTNISSIIAQRSLNNATTGLNDALEKLTTGYKINHAKDNAAGYSIANQ